MKNLRGGKEGGEKKTTNNLQNVSPLIECSCLERGFPEKSEASFSLSKLRVIPFLLLTIFYGLGEKRETTCSHGFGLHNTRVLFTRGFPALRDISPCKRARLSISKHSATTSLASSSCCQMPSLFLKLCIQGTPLFFLLEILSKKNTMFWVAWPKFSCTFASLPNFLFLAKQFIILLVL